jgi:hypothetical protein
MKKIFLIVGLLLTGANLFAQVPDNEAISAAVGNPASRFYYPVLIDRYLKGDMTLDADDYRHLYYGFAAQDDYRPLDPLRGENELLMEVERGIDSLNAQRIIELAGVVMQSDPFNPSAVNLMTYAYNLLGDSEKERISAARLAGIFGAIEGSGDGETKNSPWHVIWFTHVNDFLAMKGYTPRSRSYANVRVEYVQLEDSDRGRRGFYFDIGRIYSKPPTVIPERPKGLKPVR